MINVTASYSPKHFLLKALPLDLCLANSRVIYFWQVLESIHKFVIEILSWVLICKFVRGSNRKQREGGRVVGGRGWDSFKFHKRRDFLSLMTPITLGANLTMWSPFWHPSKKVFHSPSLRSRREHTWTLNIEESLLMFWLIFTDLPGFSLFLQEE